MLQIKNLSAGYGKAQVIRDISLEVDEGEVVALVGPNGAGKTTTLRAVSRLARAYKGSITVDGEDMLALAPHEVVRAGVVHVPEGRELFPDMSTRDNLLMAVGNAPRRTGGQTVAEQLDDVLKLFPVVRERLKQKAGSLSGGEQQMVAIARGLMFQPKILMLDEPSLGLAPFYVQEVERILRNLKQRKVTMLLVDQNVSTVLKLADRAYVMAEGEVKATGTSEQLLADDRLAKMYLR
jgi:branched-chain amino acid transport system ATP-binding protein